MAYQAPTPSLPPSRPRGSVRFMNPDIFSDEFSLEPLEVIGDHRSASSDPDDVASLPSSTDTPRRSSSFHQTFESPVASLRRSTASQRSNGLASLSSQDDRASPISRLRSETPTSDSGYTASTQHRSVNTISTFGFPRTQSPYQGATGPTHPYGMYPQGIVPTRTPSTATTSTIRPPERSYSGPNGPTQPYGMYSQNIVPEDDLAISGLAPPVAAGFPGANQNFRRHLGPDGEDVDDLVGPDGYTEQLPAYTRYANGVPPKYPSGDAVIASASQQGPVESQETLNSHLVRESSAVVNPFDDNSSTQVSSTNIATTALPKDEGGNFKEKVKKRTRRKVCCGMLPCWLLAVILLVIFLAILLGGLIGGIVTHEHSKKANHPVAVTVTAAAAIPTIPSTATVTTTTIPVDAVPLTATPSNLPILPTGSFKLALGNAQRTNYSCLTDSSQSSAWDCATGADLNLSITMGGPLGDRPLVSLSYPTSSNEQIRYGAQPPQLDKPAEMLIMQDKDDWNRGPAYFFLQQYNKTVIVKEESLSTGPPPRKRRPVEWFHRRWLAKDEVADDRTSLIERGGSSWASNTAQPGSKVWYCFWNGTVLEGFIYVTQDLNQSSSASNTVSSGAVQPLATSASSSAHNKRHNPVPSALPYPKSIKIEERRNSNPPASPYCQQFQILYNNQLGLSTWPNGQPMQIQLNETESSMLQKQFLREGDPSSHQGQPIGSSGMRRLSKRQSGSGAQVGAATGSNCMCEWETT